MTLARNLGTVTAVNAGPPPTVTIQLNGDTATDYDALYLDSYSPTVADVVQVLSDGGYHVVLGRAALGPTLLTGSGTVTITAGAVAGSAAVTFTPAFAATPVVVPAVDAPAGGVVGNFGTRILLRSASGFTVVLFRTDGTVAPGGGNVAGFTWLAHA